MCKRVRESGDYNKALCIISEYVETELSSPPKEKETKKERRKISRNAENRKDDAYDK